MLSACTIGIASQRFTRRHEIYVAILKTLGMTTFQIKAYIFSSFLYTTLLTLAVGLSLGWLFKQLYKSMSSYFPTELPVPSIYPLFVTPNGSYLSIWFIYPHILKLLSVSPMRVLKDDISFNQETIPVFVIGAIAFLFLLYLYTNQLTLSLIIFWEW